MRTVTHNSATGKVVERDMTPEEEASKEFNPCIYCFDAPWLWAHVKTLRNANAQEEYYLTDLIHMAIKEVSPISSVPVDPKEAIGINSKEQLEIAENLQSSIL